ncbi:hypothetical protein GGX14DRAFT_295985, partial [Mycena pura]
TEDVCRLLAEKFKRFYPVWYRKYRSAFEAGSWLKCDPGPFIGRAHVYKLQTAIHLDDGDEDAPTAIFCYGSFKGGAMYFPDLPVKLQFSPGSIILSMSGILYHGCEQWEPVAPTKEQDELGLTAGRVSSVFFFP